MDEEPTAVRPLGLPRILIDLANGRLDAQESQAVMDWLQATREEPPPWLTNRAIRIARPSAGHVPARPSAWRRLVAALIIDTRRQQRLAEARTASEELPRLMYQAAGIEIDLEVGHSTIAGRLRVLGQVSGNQPDVVNGWVVAEGPSGHVEATVDDLGQFVLDGLTPGPHRIQIGLPYELIEIPEVLI